MKKFSTFFLLSLILFTFTSCPGGGRPPFTSIHFLIESEDISKIEDIDIKAYIDSNEVILQYTIDTLPSFYRCEWGNKDMVNFIEQLIYIQLLSDTLHIFSDNLPIIKDYSLIYKFHVSNKNRWDYDNKLPFGFITGEISDTLWYEYIYMDTFLYY